MKQHIAVVRLGSLVQSGILRIQCGCGTVIERVGQGHSVPSADPKAYVPCSLSGARV